ncbi:MAG TPA: hypothetical protein VJV79_25645 [Polyangiaceae bacterium]|nr:hypothetical protein [Polyangiaceae bacterium]
MNLPQVGVVPPRWKYRHAAALFALLGALPSACVYDSKDRCGPHQVMYEDLRCVCDATSTMNAAGVCEPAVVGLGAACDASTPCGDPEFNYCEAGADGKGYCTKTGCASPEECKDGYACDASVTPSVCRRPPAGLGMSCTADVDCAGTEATYCDTFQSHSCLVQGCSLTPDNCFVGWECCDLSSFGVPQPLCIPQGACTT